MGLDAEGSEKDGAADGECGEYNELLPLGAGAGCQVAVYVEGLEQDEGGNDDEETAGKGGEYYFEVDLCEFDAAQQYLAQAEGYGGQPLLDVVVLPGHDLQAVIGEGEEERKCGEW